MLSLPSEFSPDTKTVTQVPSLLVDAGSDSILLVNNDANNTIYIGGDIGVSPFSRINNTIPPLGSITLDGSSGPIYAVTAIGQTAVCQIVPKGVSFAPSPVLIAQQILNSGVVIVDNPKAILTGNLTVPATPSTLNQGPFSVNTYQSWNLFFNWGGVGGSTPYVEMTLSWAVDLNSNFVTYSEVWILPVDNVSNFFGHGPHYGPYMSVQFSSYDNLPETLHWQLWGSNRSVNETTIRQQNTLNPPGYGADDILLNFDGTLAAGASSSVVPVNYYNGPVTVRFGVYSATSVNSTQLFLDFQPKAVDFNTNTSMLFAGPSTITGQAIDQFFDVNLPKRPITALVKNSQSTGSTNFRIRIIAKGAVQ